MVLLREYGGNMHVCIYDCIVLERRTSVRIYCYSVVFSLHMVFEDSKL